MNNYKYKQLTKLLTFIFITLELVLTVLVQLLSGRANTVVSFFAIVLACLFPILFINNSKDYKLTQIGLISTVFADLFLVVLEPMRQLPAMFFFSITQICYLLRIYFNQENKKIEHLIIRSIVIVISIIITILVLKDKTDFLSIISIFYYANLIMNIVYSFLTSQKSILLSIGLILFACCDLLIGISVLDSSYLNIPEGTLFYFLCHPGFNLAWLFYVPSQTLISLSVIKRHQFR